MNKLGIAVYPLRSGLPCFSPILKTERRPTLGNLNAITRSVVEKLSNHPPAEPGAFVHEPLKAAYRGR